MKVQYAVGMALLAGVGLGAVAVSGLHAQAKPPVYLVEEIDIPNPEAYQKEVLPKMAAANKNAGVRSLAAGGRVTVLDGTPPKGRVVIQVWDSLEKAKAFRDSAEYKEARTIGNKYATYHAFVVEGVSQ